MLGKASGEPKQGCKVECLLMSPDSTEYCRGVIKAVKGDKAELKRQQDKFGNGTVWTIAKVAMAKEKKTVNTTERASRY